jgi:hypothetical protein
MTRPRSHEGLLSMHLSGADDGQLAAAALPLSPASRRERAWPRTPACASKQQRLLHQTDKQLLRLFRRVRDGLVDAGLHKTARRIERRGRKGVVDDP